MSSFSNITVAILAGGLGSRLHSINNNKQKVVIEVNDRPFLQYLLEKLDSSGCQNIVFCTGYLGDQVEKIFGKKYKNLRLNYSREDLPLGTAGALRLALPFLKSKEVLVMNGDSYCEADLQKFWKFHRDTKADTSLVVTYLSNIDRYGKVTLEKDRIISFEEKKAGNGAGYINAGVYFINKSLIYEIKEKKQLSLETEIFPKWISKKIYGYKTDEPFIDIGTPESYSKTKEFFKGKRFILLDRDGTLVIHKPYLSHPDQIELIPGVVEALKEFKKIGLGIVVITNQSGIGRGYFDLETLDKIHQRLTDLLAQEGIVLNDIYFCPHTPEDNCLCRKPKVRLIELAAKKHQFESKLCFVIGDNKSDIELGRNIGATTILVRTGYGRQIEKELTPDYVVDNLAAILPIIKNELAKEHQGIFQ